jgi:membrane protease YdiL (CAAX protease family)
MMQAARAQKLRTLRIIEFILVTLVPVSIMTFGLIPGILRYGILLAVAVFAGGVIRYRNWTRSDLGLTQDTFIYWRQYAFWTTCAFIGILIYWKFLGISRPVWSQVMVVKLIGVSIALSFIQEFLYRSYLFRLWNDISHHAWLVITLNVVVFTYMHTIFPNWEIVLPLTGVGGILFAIMYHRYPNFWMISSMHVVLNFTVLYLGFFPVALLEMR